MRLEKKSIIAVMLLAVLMLSGCAQKTAEEVVFERSQVQLNLLMEGDFAAAYDYTTPGYREVATLGDFISRRMGVSNWTAAVVDSVTCEPEVCHVITSVTYERKAYNLVNTKALNEKWLKIGGKWYLYNKNK